MEPPSDPRDLSRGVAIDPVCGMQVVIETTAHPVDHEGTAYYFCGRGCRLDFEEDPDRFLDPSYVPSM
jgi:YHS domain-containing protein